MIRLVRPEMSSAEIEAASRVLRSGRLVQGEEVGRFEEELAAYLGVEYAVAVSSGTAALHVSLLALGVGPGVEVIIPDFTFPATGNTVFLAGAVPVLADVDEDSLTLDLREFKRRLSPRTRVVVPVHLFGYPAAVDSLAKAAAEARISLLEDAAGALGSSRGDRFCGTVGRAGVFSFHPRKIITTGEGGAVVTDDEKVAELVRRYRNHGAVRDEGGTRFELAGLNYRMTEMAAAIGRVKLRRLPEILQAKRKLAERYRELLEEVPEVGSITEPQGASHSYQAFVVWLPPEVSRRDVIRGLASRGVEATLGTYALHAQPLYQHRLGCREGEYPVSWSAFRRTLALPFYPELTVKEATEVISALKESLSEASREEGAREERAG